MPTNKTTWVGNAYGLKEPLVMLGNFQAGATQAVKRGEILELTAGGNTQWIPMDSDFAGSANVAVANEEIKSGDRAGYYEIIVPRPGDIFEFELAAAGATTIGTGLYWSTSQKLTVTAGTNIMAYAVGQEHYPLKQGHLSDDADPDRGTTVKSASYVRCMIREAYSYYSLFAK